MQLFCHRLYTHSYRDRNRTISGIVLILELWKWMNLHWLCLAISFYCYEGLLMCSICWCVGSSNKLVRRWKCERLTLSGVPDRVSVSQCVSLDTSGSQTLSVGTKTTDRSSIPRPISLLLPFAVPLSWWSRLFFFCCNRLASDFKL